MTTFMRSLKRAFLLIIIAAPLAAPASAAFPEGADTFVRGIGDQAVETLKDETLSRDQIEERFRKIFRETFYVPAIGRFVLGKYWRQASEQQRREFLDLFEEFIVRTYAKRFKDYTGETLQVREARQASDTQAIVISEIVRPEAPPIKVDWRVGIPKDSQDYRVYDVTIEGISMAVTQRSEFATVIQRRGKGVDGLLEALREKIAELNT
ncbi:MAG: ABC transporter substrate-binding protein [Alphaproteobacteria bacterium]